MKNEFVRLIYAPWELYRTASGIKQETLKGWFTAGWMAAVLLILGLLIAAAVI